MATAHPALRLYEIVELIVSNLDRPSIHRCERVSHIFRTVALESPAVAQTLLALTPIRVSDIKTLSWQEIEELSKSGNSFASFFGVSLRHMNDFRYQLTDATHIHNVPHYARPTKFEFNPHLNPRIIRSETGICDVSGTTVELRLPEKGDQGGLVSPDHYATSPAISVVKMKLRAHGTDFCECWLRVPSGIRLRDLVWTQKAMLKTISEYGGCCGGMHAQRCIAVFRHDTLASRLRYLGVQAGVQ